MNAQGNEAGGSAEGWPLCLSRAPYLMELCFRECSRVGRTSPFNSDI